MTGQQGNILYLIHSYSQSNAFLFTVVHSGFQHENPIYLMFSRVETKSQQQKTGIVYFAK